MEAFITNPIFGHLFFGLSPSLHGPEGRKFVSSSLTLFSLFVYDLTYHTLKFDVKYSQFGKV